MAGCYKCAKRTRYVQVLCSVFEASPASAADTSEKSADTSHGKHAGRAASKAAGGAAAPAQKVNTSQKPCCSIPYKAPSCRHVMQVRALMAHAAASLPLLTVVHNTQIQCGCGVFALDVLAAIIELRAGGGAAQSSAWRQRRARSSAAGGGARSHAAGCQRPHSLGFGLRQGRARSPSTVSSLSNSS